MDLLASACLGGNKLTGDIGRALLGRQHVVAAITKCAVPAQLAIKVRVGLMLLALLWWPWCDLNAPIDDVCTDSSLLHVIALHPAGIPGVTVHSPMGGQWVRGQHAA